MASTDTASSSARDVVLLCSAALTANSAQYSSSVDAALALALSSAYVSTTGRCGRMCSGASQMMASLVIIRLLTDDASSSAVRTTCAARARARARVAGGGRP